MSVSMASTMPSYTNWDRSSERNSIHVVDLKSGADRVLDPDATRNQGFASFSPDTRYLAFVVDEDPWNAVWIEAVDGSSPARQLGPKYLKADGGYLFGRFSPDARSILIVDEASKVTGSSTFSRAAKAASSRGYRAMSASGSGWRRRSRHRDLTQDCRHHGGQGPRPRLGRGHARRPPRSSGTSGRRGSVMPRQPTPSGADPRPGPALQSARTGWPSRSCRSASVHGCDEHPHA
jgi:hypothetical protein